MVKKGLLFKTQISNLGLTVVKKTPEDAYKPINMLAGLQEFAEGRWEEIQNL